MWLLIAFKVLGHLALGDRYGIFRDELYFLACGRHLDFGYVDQPPLIAWISAFTQLLFGESLTGLRLPVALAGGGLLYFTARITQAIGGGLFARSLACVCVLMAPGFLAIGHILTMNVFEHLLWAIGAFLLLRLVKEENTRLWPALGLVLGLGFLNKITFLLLAAFTLAGLALSPKRHLLRSRWFVLALGVALLTVSPYLYWQIREGWPSYEFFQAYARKRDLPFTLLDFFSQQVLTLQPNSLLVWVPGLAWLLLAKQARAYRVFGFSFALAFATFAATKAKFYFLLPMVPPLFAAGAVAWERGIGHLGRARSSVAVAMLAVFLVGGAVSSVEAVPVLDAGIYLEYAPTRQFQEKVKLEAGPTAELPPHFADMHGWEELAQSVRSIYLRLPQDEQSEVAVLTWNYGQAGAIDYFRRQYELPPAISGHNNYYLWGPGSRSLSTLISVGIPENLLRRFYAEVRPLGPVNCAYCMPNERNAEIFLSRHPLRSVREHWSEFKHYD